MQPTIILEGNRRTDRVQMFVATATVIEPGDLLYASVGKVYAVAASTIASKFVGISGEGSSASEFKAITVHLRCIITIDVTAASYYVGAGVKYKSDNAMQADSGSNTMAWAHENVVGSTATRIKVLIDAPMIAGLYGLT